MLLLSLTLSAAVHMLIAGWEVSRPAAPYPITGDARHAPLAPKLRAYNLSVADIDEPESIMVTAILQPDLLEDLSLAPEGILPAHPLQVAVLPVHYRSARPAAALRPRPGNFVLWRRVVGAEPAFPAAIAELLRSPSTYRDPNVGFTTPADVAFGTWVAAAGNGERWGAAGGILYLGELAVPTCGGHDASDCGFGLPPWKRDRYKLWMTALTELDRQEFRADLQRRALAIRARRDDARASIRR